TVAARRRAMLQRTSPEALPASHDGKLVSVRASSRFLASLAASWAAGLPSTAARMAAVAAPDTTARADMWSSIPDVTLRGQGSRREIWPPCCERATRIVVPSARLVANCPCGSAGDEVLGLRVVADQGGRRLLG